MTLIDSCRAFAPDIVCRNGDIFLYLLPSAFLAIVIRALARSHPLFFLFTVLGTVSHELAHFVAGLVTGARPASFTVIPRRVGQHWELGSVMLTRVRWYNAAPAALAPLLVILLPLAVAWWRTRPGWAFQPVDLCNNEGHRYPASYLLVKFGRYIPLLSVHDPETQHVHTHASTIARIA
mgnify:CR=1 FL=1